MQKAEGASVVWLNSDVQIASFHYEDGYKQLNFSNQVFFMSFLQSLMESGYRLCSQHYFNKNGAAAGKLAAAP